MSRLGPEMRAGPGRPRPGGPRRLVPVPTAGRPRHGVVVAALFAAVFAIRLLAYSSSDPLGLLYVVPVLAAAWWFGATGAAGAVAASLLLVAAWDIWLGGQVTASGFLVRAAVLVAVGAAAGTMMDRFLTTVDTWEALLRSSPDAVVGVDSDGSIIEVSDQAAEMFGYRPEQLLGRPVETLLPVDLRPSHPRHVASFWSSPRFRPMMGGRALAAVTASGEEIPVEITLAPVVRRGRLAVLATLRDVSARRQAEEDLRRSETRFRGAIETMLDPFIILGPLRDEAGEVTDYVHDYVNAAAAADYGIPVERLIGRRLLDIRPFLRGGSLLGAYHRVLASGEPLVVSEVSFASSTDPDTPRRYCDIRATRLADSLACTWRDVTAQVQARAELRQAYHQFEAAFDRAPAGVALVALDLTIRQANEAFADMLSVTAGGLIGRSLADLTDSASGAEAVASLVEVVSGHAPTYRAELRLTGGYGQPVWVSLSAARVPDELDRPGYLIVHIENVSARREYEERLVYMASHDGLTGLLNRRQFTDDLDHHLALNQRYGGGGALMLFDLDNFKYVNDTLGHAAGDQVIRSIADTLRGRLRDTDLLARLGGDEFAVLAPGADETGARHLAETLIDAARQGAGTGAAPGRIRTSASAGVVLLESGGGSAADVLAHADLAMYAAKDEGRDRYVVYDPGSPHLARWHARFRWIDRIREALEKEQFVLHAQPILRLSEGHVTHYELLLRMRSGNELIGPGRFLYIAEQHGLARSIDQWVVREAIRVAARYPGPAERRFEVNLSADSLGDPELPDLIAASLARDGVDPRQLIFEITETAAISNFGAARAFVERITDLGCGFALDDFGAGYGSFYYLKHLPLQYLKIDGEFIRQLPSSRTDQLIVKAVVSAAHGLGKLTIAEYVGDRATLEALRRYGVDFAQGYHVGRPTDPATAFGPDGPGSPEPTPTGTGHSDP